MAMVKSSTGKSGTVAECAATQELTAEQGLTSSLQVKAEFASNIQLDIDTLNLPFIQVDSLTLRQCRTVIPILQSYAKVKAGGRRQQAGSRKLLV